MRINNEMPDSDILMELGSRIKACRIRRSFTQSELAELSGVSKGTIANVEGGQSIQLENLLRILRELDELNSLEVLLPSSDSTPMELIRNGSDRKRQRVRSKRDSSSGNRTDWRWGDDK